MLFINAHQTVLLLIDLPQGTLSEIQGSCCLNCDRLDSMMGSVVAYAPIALFGLQALCNCWFRLSRGLRQPRVARPT